MGGLTRGLLEQCSNTRRAPPPRFRRLLESADSKSPAFPYPPLGMSAPKIQAWIFGAGFQDFQIPPCSNNLWLKLWSSFLPGKGKSGAGLGQSSAGSAKSLLQKSGLKFGAGLLDFRIPPCSKGFRLIVLEHGLDFASPPLIGALFQ